MGWLSRHVDVRAAELFASPKIRLCPTTKKFRHELADPFNSGLDATFLAWGEIGRNNYPVPQWADRGDYGSYGINAWTHNPPASLLGQFTPNQPANYWRKISVVQSGERIPVFADCIWDGTATAHTDAAPPQQGRQDSSMSLFAIPRHTGSRPVNVAFLDASVSAVGLKELWRLKWHQQFDTAAVNARNQWPAWMGKYK